MPKFVIEREIPKIGASSPEQCQGIAGQSCAVLEKMGPHIQWLLIPKTHWGKNGLPASEQVASKKAD